MEKPSFQVVHADLEAACGLLRAFTLGEPGITPKHGRARIERVNAECERMKKLFSSGKHATQAATAVASARGRIAAAEARLVVLAKKE